MRLDLSAVLGFAICLACNGAALTSAAESRPNVVVLVLEDVSPERFGAYGNAVCKTPNIDRLAAQGVRFTNFYTTPPCCPARTSMMTGVRPENSKVFDNSDARLAGDLLERVTTLPEAFRDGGYETVRIGKFAHDDREKDAWTRIATRGEGIETDASGKKPSGKPVMKPAEGPHADPSAKFVGAPFLYGPSGLPDQDHDDYHTAGAAIKVIREQREKPLFLAVGFHAGHLAFRAPDAYFAMYPADKIELPQVPGAGPDGLPTKKALLEARKVSGFNATGFNNPATVEQWRAAIAAQYACLTFVDVQIGRVLDEIDAAGRADETIVILWSDHGFLMGEHFLWRKGLLYDADNKSAFIVRAPGAMQPGTVCSRIVETVDLYPTLTDLCGLTTPEHIEGRSFKPLLTQPDLPWKRAALIYRDKGRSVGATTERWRLNRFEDHPERDALYDHDADPAENRNVIADPQYAAALKELDACITAGWKSCLPPNR